MSDGNSEDEEREVNYETHPSLSLTLQELRNRFEDEEDRRKTLETKIGILLTVNAIIISLIGVFDDILNVYRIATLLPAVLSAGLALMTLRPRDYSRPGKEVDEMILDAKKEEHEFEDKYVFSYRDSISSNQEINESRYLSFKVCFYLTIISLLLFVVGISTMTFYNL